jgi:hypothetical protein
LGNIISRLPLSATCHSPPRWLAAQGTSVADPSAKSKISLLNGTLCLSQGGKAASAVLAEQVNFLRNTPQPACFVLKT